MNEKRGTSGRDLLRNPYQDWPSSEQMPNRDRTLYTSSFDGQAFDLPWGTPGNYAPLPHYEGQYRDLNSKPGTSATNDLEAVAVWLAQKGRRSQNTAIRYRREIERLLLWAADQGRCLSDLGQEDFLRYEKFLEKPEPKGRWVMSKSTSRNSPDWRPFRATKLHPDGGLSPQGRHESLAICRSAIHKLQKMNWITKTEVMGDIQPTEREPMEGKEPNALTEAEVDAVKLAINRISNPIDRLRMKWLTELFIVAGPRVSEVTECSMSALTMKLVENKSLWVITLLGKGGRKRTIPLPHQILLVLGDFRESLGLPRTPGSYPWEQRFPIAPKIGQRRHAMTFDEIHNAQGMTANGIYKRYQSIFRDAAEHLSESGNFTASEKLKVASTHDLRHTALKRLADSTGGDMRLVQKLAGHRSISTSAMYARSGLTELEEALIKLLETK